MAWDDICQAIRQWLVNSSGLQDGKVIFADQAAPRPTPGPFITLKPRLAQTRRGVYDLETIDEETDGQLNRRGIRNLTSSINVFGPGAIALADQVQDALESYVIRDALNAAGIAVIDAGEVRDLTRPLETRVEERAQFDVLFAYTVESTETVGWIETVEGEATYLGTPPAGVAVTEEFTITSE